MKKLTNEGVKKQTYIWKNIGTIIITWMTRLLKIPITYRVMYMADDGSKIVVLVETNLKGGKTTQTHRFLVEHLLDENLQVTPETLEQEKEIFRHPTDYPSSNK